MQFEHGEPDQQIGAVGIVAAIEQRQDRFMQQPRYPHHEFGIEAGAAMLPLKPLEIEIQRPHLDIREHVDGMLQPRRHPHRAVRRHQPASLRRGHLHGAAGGINQLRLAVHMGAEPDAFPVVARDQMDAADQLAMGGRAAEDWRFGDTHWRHPVRTKTYNLILEKLQDSIS